MGKNDVKLRTIRYGITANLGNFSSERVDVEVEVPEGMSDEEAISRARAKAASVSPYVEKVTDHIEQVIEHQKRLST